MISSNRLKPAEQHPDPGSATPRPVNLLNYQHDSELKITLFKYEARRCTHSLWAQCTVDAARTQQSRQISSLQPQMCFSSRWFVSLLTTVTLSAASMSAQQILASCLIDRDGKRSEMSHSFVLFHYQLWRNSRVWLSRCRASWIWSLIVSAALLANGAAKRSNNKIINRL